MIQFMLYFQIVDPRDIEIKRCIIPRLSTVINSLKPTNLAIWIWIWLEWMIGCSSSHLERQSWSNRLASLLYWAGKSFTEPIDVFCSDFVKSPIKMYWSWVVGQSRTESDRVGQSRTESDWDFSEISPRTRNPPRSARDIVNNYQ